MRSVREAFFRSGLDWREASLFRAMSLETVRYLERKGTPFQVPPHLREVGRLVGGEAAGGPEGDPDEEREEGP